MGEGYEDYMGDKEIRRTPELKKSPAKRQELE